MMRIMRSNDPQKSMGDILGDIKMIHKSDVTEKLEDVSGIKELERRYIYNRTVHGSSVVLYKFTFLSKGNIIYLRKNISVIFFVVTINQSC